MTISAECFALITIFLLFLLYCFVFLFFCLFDPFSDLNVRALCLVQTALSIILMETRIGSSIFFPNIGITFYYTFLIFYFVIFPLQNKPKSILQIYLFLFVLLYIRAVCLFLSFAFLKKKLFLFLLYLIIFFDSF